MSACNSLRTLLSSNNYLIKENHVAENLFKSK